jgi:hypothetical protein
MMDIQGFQQTVKIVEDDKVKSHPKHSDPELFGGNGRQVPSYCHRGNSTVEVSTPTDLPYSSEVPNHYQGSPVHSFLYHDVHQYYTVFELRMF